MNYVELKDFAYKLKNKLCEDVNGKVTYTIYNNQESIALNIEFKDFHYTTLVTDIQDKIYQNVTIEEISESIKKDYKNEIMNSFFKSEHRKRIDNERKVIGLEYC